jgi:hypothetical protein
VLDVIALHLPEENLDRLFKTMTAWARFGNLWHYNEDTERLTLVENE